MNELSEETTRKFVPMLVKSERDGAPSEEDGLSEDKASGDWDILNHSIRLCAL